MGCRGGVGKEERKGEGKEEERVQRRGEGAEEERRGAERRRGEEGWRRGAVSQVGLVYEGRFGDSSVFKF